MIERTNVDDFRARGVAYSEAFEILAQGIRVPPSLEGFEHLLQEAQDRSMFLTPQLFARRLVSIEQGR